MTCCSRGVYTLFERLEAALESDGGLSSANLAPDFANWDKWTPCENNEKKRIKTLSRNHLPLLCYFPIWVQSLHLLCIVLEFMVDTNVDISSLAQPAAQTELWWQWCDGFNFITRHLFCSSRPWTLLIFIMLLLHQLRSVVIAVLIRDVPRRPHAASLVVDFTARTVCLLVFPLSVMAPGDGLRWASEAFQPLQSGEAEASCCPVWCCCRLWRQKKYSQRKWKSN